MPKFFRFPWASTGDKTTIPDETDVAGFVSYQQGYGNDYARDPASDPLAKLIERDKMNQLYSDLTENVQYWQIHAFPEYITAAQNGGVAYAYDINAIVRYNGGTGYKVYQNTVAGNTNAPDVSGWVEITKHINIDTIAELAFFDSTVCTSIYVKDANRGGLFSWSATGTANGGTVFAGATGYWIRQYIGPINVKWFGAKGDGVADDTEAIVNASLAGTNGVYIASGIYKVSTLNINPIMVEGAGEGKTILLFDNNTISTDGIVFNAPTAMGVEFGIRGVTIKTVNGNGRYAITTPSASGLNNLRPKITIEHINFRSENTASTTDSFAQDYSWEFMLLLGDSWNMSIRNIDALGSYLPELNPTTQLLDGFIRFAPSQGILSCRLENITTHNVANFIEIKQKTYFHISNVDVARAYRGVYDAPDRVFETNVYAYGESQWDNVIINAQLFGVKLKYRYSLQISNLIISRDSNGFDHSDIWYGLYLEGARATSIKGITIGSALSIFTPSQVGILIDGGDANNISDISFGSLDLCFQGGVTASSFGSAQAIFLNNISILNTVTKVFDLVNTRGFRASQFSKSSGFSYTTFVTYADAITQFSSFFIACPTDMTIETEDDFYWSRLSGGTDAKRWRWNFSDTSLNFSTQGDSGQVGNNAILMTRSGLDVTKIELRNTGYNYFNAPENHFGGLAKPSVDNSYSLGSASYRWSVVYAGTGTINTSDDREKAYIDITEAEKQVALELKANMRKFKFNDAIELKGYDNARIHFGASAQTVKSIFEKYGLNGFDYAVLCYDEWEEQQEVKGEDGTIIELYRPSGNRYGIRYEELLCFIISAM